MISSRPFGPAFSREVCITAASLSRPDAPVDVRWVLEKIALESSFDPFARNASGARGLWQKMPVNGVEYRCPAPHVQMQEARAFWSSFQTRNNVGGFRSSRSLYCMNLAPARLIGGVYDDDTIIYSANIEDKPLNALGGRWSLTYWPRAYRDNAEAFGLDRLDPNGRIRMRDLDVGLQAGVRRCQARFDAELEAAYVANVNGSPPPDAA